MAQLVGHRADEQMKGKWAVEAAAVSPLYSVTNFQEAENLCVATMCCSGHIVAIMGKLALRFASLNSMFIPKSPITVDSFSCQICLKRYED